jgi:uncharacterized membrane protein YheB (UPF0754 family)
VSVLAGVSVGGAWHVFTAHPVVLLLMPMFGAFIGWITKVMMIWMIFNPIEFRGIGPIGWQGQIPKRAAKIGSEATEMILGKLIDPRELIDLLDPERIAVELDGVIVDVVDDVARGFLGARWDVVPAAAKAPIVSRCRASAPNILARLLRQAKANIDELFDLSYVATAHLVKNKPLLNELMGDTVQPELRFMKRFGTLFGGVVGAAQMVIFAFTKSHLLIPLAGLSVGFVSDWFALQLVFRPRAPRRYLGIFRWQGLFFKRRDEFAADYARLAATKILTPQVVMDAILEGPLGDRLFQMVRSEVQEAISDELRLVEPLVPASVGSDRYRAVGERVITHARARLPEAASRIEGYAADAVDLERMAREALMALSDEEYENMIRPMLKDDEWLVVVVGGVLGFLVGEFQVFLLERLGGL